MEIYYIHCAREIERCKKRERGRGVMRERGRHLDRERERLHGILQRNQNCPPVNWGQCELERERERDRGRER